MKKVDIAWVAGFVDGEGCIHYLKNCPTLTVTQAEIEPLSRMRQIFKVGRIYCQKSKIKNHSDIYRYRVYGANALYVLSLLLPYLTVKRRQAIETFDSRRPRYSIHLGWKGKKTRLIEILELRERKHSFEDIGKILGISRQRAHQLYQIAITLKQTYTNPNLLH